MSSPFFILANLDVRPNILTGNVNSYCYEVWTLKYLNTSFEQRLLKDWEHNSNKLIYTIICFVIQHLIPSLSVGFIYSRISSTITQTSSTDFSSKVVIRKMAIRKKTNRMLMMVSLVFFTSWAPLNIFNLVMDVFSPLRWVKFEGDACSMFFLDIIVKNVWSHLIYSLQGRA